MRKFYTLLTMVAIGVTSMLAGVTPKSVKTPTMYHYDLSRFGIETPVKTDVQNLADLPEKAPVAAAEEDETWSDYGVAEFYDGWIMPAFGISPDLYNWSVPVQKSSKGDRYKLIAPWHQEGLQMLFTALQANYPFTDDKFDLIVDCTNPDKVTMEYQPGVTFKAGYLNQLSPVQVDVNLVANALIAGGITEEKVIEAGYMSTVVDGNITLRGACLGTKGTPVGQALNRFAFEMYNTKIKLPNAKDYSLSASVSNVCAHDASTTLNVEKGVDVATVKYCVYPGGRMNAHDNNFNVLEQMGLMQPLESESATIPVVALDESQIVTVFVAAYKADGRRVEQTTAYYIQHVDDADQWNALGEADFTEDLLGLFYKNPQTNRAFGATTYKVTVQEHKTKHGLYRIVNPYAAPCPMAAINEHETTHNYYLNIDATDPDKVFIPYSYVGFEGGYGCEILVGVNFFDETDKAALWGKLQDGVITLPENSVYDTTILDPTPNETCLGKFRLVLPAGAGVDGVSVDSDADAPVEYYNLQGVRLMNPAKGQLVIKRQGGTVTKEYVR